MRLTVRSAHDGLENNEKHLKIAIMRSNVLDMRPTSELKNARSLTMEKW
jgi:hypothetical protein